MRWTAIMAGCSGSLVLGALVSGCSGGSGGHSNYPSGSAAPGATAGAASSTPAGSASSSTGAAPAAPPSNVAPVVSALGPGAVHALNMPLAVEASARDDGLPAGATLTWAWTKESGPGDVTFSAPTRGLTAVAFSRTGDYVLRAVVSDGDLSTETRLTVQVGAPAAIPAFPLEGFIGRTVDDEATALAYYETIDPRGERTTLDRFRARNGMNQAPAVEAVYFNAGDLGFGRRMSMQRTNEGVIMSVTNYASAEDAVADRDVIATVSMEFTPGPAGGAAFTKFYVFDAQGRRVTGADLDGAGFKNVPALCISCHGGKAGSVMNGVYSNGGDVGAKFLPFDLEQFTFADIQGARRADQEREFRELNKAVLETNASAAAKELVEGWYGGAGLPNQVQNPAFVPAGWAGHEALYLGVVAHSCRTCHVQMAPALDFARWADFNSLALVSSLRVVDERRMPDARVTFQRFWNSNQPALLVAGLDVPVAPVQARIPLTGTRVEARLDRNPTELLQARELVWELSFLRDQTPARLITEARALETAQEAFLTRLEQGPGADPVAATLLDTRLDELRRRRRDLETRLAQDGAAAILTARDRYVRDADRTLADLSRAGTGRDQQLLGLRQVVDGAQRAVADIRDLRAAMRTARLPVVESPR